MLGMKGISEASGRAIRLREGVTVVAGPHNMSGGNKGETVVM